MPVMSGFDAVAALRAKAIAEPIFALTAYQDGPEAERALSSGCDALLGKPINSERLRRHVGKLGSWACRERGAMSTLDRGRSGRVGTLQRAARCSR